MTHTPENIHLEVALAFPKEQHIATVSVAAGTCATHAIEKSGIFSLFYNEVPIDVQQLQYGIGIFGKEIKDPEHYFPKDGERIEIYRPLLIDPKQARANRMQKNKRVTDNAQPRK